MTLSSSTCNTGSTHPSANLPPSSSPTTNPPTPPAFVYQRMARSQRQHISSIQEHVLQYPSSEEDAQLPLQLRSDEPTLYNLPSSTSLSYRPIPLSTKIALALFSLVSTVFITMVERNHATFVGSTSGRMMKKSMRLGLKRMGIFVATFALSFLSIQDVFFSPSRISTSALLENNWLPSTLSKYRKIPYAATFHRILLGQNTNHLFQEDTIDPEPIGVHYLQYDNPSSTENGAKKDPYKYDAIHFCHGFGASSLSWLVAIPKITQRFNARLSVAHDSPGLGFTDRPKPFANVPRRGWGKRSMKDKICAKNNGLVPYSAAGSAAIGNSILDYALAESETSKSGNKMKSGSAISEFNHDESTRHQPTDGRKLVLFGHSMGAASTLRMALSLPKEDQIRIILVAPALIGGVPRDDERGHDQNQHVNNDKTESTNLFSTAAKAVFSSYPADVIRFALCIMFVSLRKIAMDIPMMFFLKRLVAIPNFWGRALKMIWGDPNKVTDSDVLRFAWPSIARGWEQGLLSFTRSRITGTCAYPGGELKLLKDVIERENVQHVTIVHGTKDRLIPMKLSEGMVRRFPAIELVKVDDIGHDPFEEMCIDEFIDTIEPYMDG